MVQATANNACVLGLGKLGLPVAVAIAQSGFVVTGADIDPVRVDTVNRGTEPFPGEAHLGERLRTVVDTKVLRATTDVSHAVAASRVIIVTVPLLTDETTGDPDYQHLDQAIGDIGAAVQPHSVVILETTLPVGDTRDRFAPRLAELSGLIVGHDLFVAHSPERVSSGRIFHDLAQYPKLVGGVTSACGEQAADFYRTVLTFNPRPDLARENGVWVLGSSDEAEFAKLAETTYRNVNIGLANEFATFAQPRGLDVHSVIEAANSQPFSHIHQPGPSVGGHCIPVYPHLYLRGDPGATIPRASVAVNESMPIRTVDLLASELSDGLSGASVLILGVSYRPGVKAVERSGVFPLAQELGKRGAHVFVSDPLFDAAEISELGLTPFDGEPIDGLILHTAHGEFLQLRGDDFAGIKAVIDGRGHLDRDDWTGTSFVVLGSGAG